MPPNMVNKVVILPHRCLVPIFCLKANIIIDQAGSLKANVRTNQNSEDQEKDFFFILTKGKSQRFVRSKLRMKNKN